jgi:hypothetical protein
VKKLDKVNFVNKQAVALDVISQELYKSQLTELLKFYKTPDFPERALWKTDELDKYFKDELTNLIVDNYFGYDSKGKAEGKTKTPKQLVVAFAKETMLNLMAAQYLFIEIEKELSLGDFKAEAKSIVQIQIEKSLQRIEDALDIEPDNEIVAKLLKEKAHYLDLLCKFTGLYPEKISSTNIYAQAGSNVTNKNVQQLGESVNIDQRQLTQIQGEAIVDLFNTVSQKRQHQLASSHIIDAEEV